MYNIPVYISGLGKRRRTIGLLHIVAGFFLIGNADRVYKSFGQNSYLLLFPLLLVALFFIVYGLFRKKFDPEYRYNLLVRLLQALLFFGLALVFLWHGAGKNSIGLFLWAAISGTLAITEKVALQEPVVAFTEKGCPFPNGFARKNIAWHSVSDVTLRPDFLTIHYPNNRFLQFELKQALPPGAAANLQDFCRRHLEKSGSGSKAEST